LSKNPSISGVFEAVSILASPLLQNWQGVMKLRFFLAVLAAACLSVKVRSDALLAITEINESLTVTFNGSGPFGTITPLGPHSWDVQLPTGYAFFNVTGSFFVGEPESASEVNIITIRDETTLNWLSDVPTTELGPFDNPFILPDGGTLPNQTIFALSLADITTAPDAGSTFLLSAVSFLLLGVLRRSKMS
jgi:hypothetical protein